jgi:hypothetical protein
VIKTTLNSLRIQSLQNPCQLIRKLRIVWRFLTEFFEKSDTSGGVFDTLSVIKVNLRDLQVKSFKQCTILNYLGMCKEGK